MYENGTWINLTGAGSTTNLVSYSGASNGKQTIMGSRTTKVLESSNNYVDSVLVLESPDKAMVLLHITNSQSTVNSPYPGIMCYDTVKKALAVFDGSVWNYWK